MNLTRDATCEKRRGQYSPNVAVSGSEKKKITISSDTPATEKAKSGFLLKTSIGYLRKNGIIEGILYDSTLR
eukprot:jgi/Antlo1/1898/68